MDEHKFLKEWCGGVYHMMLFSTKADRKELSLFSQSQLNYHFKKKLTYTATIAGDKMTVDCADYTIVYTHSSEMDKRLLTLTHK